MGKLIVIEGSDGSGKQTQSELLYKHLLNCGKKVRLVSFPNYDSEDCNMLKSMLRGDFGKDIKNVNVYATCYMYAMDRWSSFQKEWKQFYEDGGTIICDRYVESMMIYACNRYGNYDDKLNILKFIKDTEYSKLQLPVPDIIFYLNRSYIDVKQDLKNRNVYNKTGSEITDIIEGNANFVKSINYTALELYNDTSLGYFTNSWKWNVINYNSDDGTVKNIDEVHNIIKNIIGDSDV